MRASGESKLPGVSDSAGDSPTGRPHEVDAPRLRDRRTGGVGAAIGAFSSGFADTSTNHDEAFVESVAPLIPDLSARPWPKPIEYVLVAWLVAVGFGPLMLLFWALSEDPFGRTTLLVTFGFLGGCAVFVVSMTELTHRTVRASRRAITRAVLRSLPRRLRL